MQLLINSSVVFFCALFTLTKGKDTNFQICESNNVSFYSKSVNIRNAVLQTTNEQTECWCSISSNTYLNIALKVFVLMCEDTVNDQFPLEIEYEKGRRTHVINTLRSLQSLLQTDTDDIIVAENATDITVKLEKQSNATADVKFVLQVKTSNEIEDFFNITCLSADRNNDTRKTPDEVDNNEIFGYIEDLCSSSPQLVILLASVCVALLIIILIVSIILCCVMPKKQQAQILKIRHSKLLDTGDTTFTGNNADRIRPEVRLSDNPQKTTADDNISDVPFPPDYFNKTYQYRQSLIAQNVNF